LDKPVRIAAFYKFVPLPDYRDVRPALLDVCRAAPVRGTILLASEGINGAIAGDAPAVEAALSFLRADPRLADLLVKDSFHDVIPFGRMKVRLKREIVAMKVPGIDPRSGAGAYVEPEDWNRLITQNDVLLLDARNDYEARMGSFRGSRNPETNSFHELPGYMMQNLDPAQHKRVAMFCTGGIRCEKASAFLLGLGFEAVYHLRGGILHYLEKVKPEDSLWEGECFVFDERVTVDHALEKGGITICDDCKAVVNVTDEACPQCRSRNFL